MDIENFVESIVGIDVVPFRSQLIEDEPSSFHTHTFYEFFYVISGSIRHYFNGTIETLTVGDLYMLKPGDTHMFFSEESSHIHRDILIAPKMWQSFCSFIHLDLSDALLPSQQKVNISPIGIELFEKTFSLFFKYSQEEPDAEKNPFSFIILSKTVEMFLTYMDKKDSAPPVWFLQLTNRLAQPSFFTTNQNNIFGELHYSHEYICRLFQKYLHETPTNYINHKRLDYAASLLCSTNDSIKDICFKSGFHNLAYFNRAFKKRFQTTPTNFRQSLGTAVYFTES